VDGVELIRTQLDAMVAGFANLARDAPSEEQGAALRLRTERGPEALVLKYGHAFIGTSWDTWRGRGYRRRKQGSCFHNALDYSWRYDDLTYVEGFALSHIGEHPFVAHHAWCVTEDGRVVDPTWPDASEETTYLGIRFPTKLSAELALAEGGNHLDALTLGDGVTLDQLDPTLRGGDAG
jgi:hypothetical protein